jgi:hypothetical protein
MSPPRRKPDHRLEADSRVKIWIYHDYTDTSVIWDRVGRRRGGTIHKAGALSSSATSPPLPDARVFPAGTYFAPAKSGHNEWDVWLPRPTPNDDDPAAEAPAVEAPPKPEQELTMDMNGKTKAAFVNALSAAKARAASAPTAEQRGAMLERHDVIAHLLQEVERRFACGGGPEVKSDLWIPADAYGAILDAIRVGAHRAPRRAWSTAEADAASASVAADRGAMLERFDLVEYLSYEAERRFLYAARGPVWITTGCFKVMLEEIMNEAHRTPRRFLQRPPQDHGNWAYASNVDKIV